MSAYVFTRSAKRDLAEATGYVTKAIAERILQAVERLARREFEGPSVKLVTGAIVHVWPVPPFRIYYERNEAGMTVLRVYHSAREPIES